MKRVFSVLFFLFAVALPMRAEDDCKSLAELVHQGRSGFIKDIHYLYLRKSGNTDYSPCTWMGKAKPFEYNCKGVKISGMVDSYMGDLDYSMSGISDKNGNFFPFDEIKTASRKTVACKPEAGNIVMLKQIYRSHILKGFGGHAWDSKLIVKYIYSGIKTPKF